VPSDQITGTYTYPISFSIPSYLPPTIHCEHGSVTWHLKAEVHRPGVFTQKLTASRDVTFVVSPSDDNMEDTEVVFIERFWKDQFQYMVSISGRVFPIGGTIPITLRLSPIDKVKIYRILAQIEGHSSFFSEITQIIT
jgi:arrestin-related trafficking adapter 3/6